MCITSDLPPGALLLPLPLPAPTLIAAQGVVGLRDYRGHDPGRDQAFIDAVRPEFANLLNRVALPPEAPPNAPHLVLASTSSQLALSAVQADFQVRFYGDYLNDVPRALEYVERKLATVFEGFQAIDTAIASIGLIGTLNFSFEDLEQRPVDHILQTHLRPPTDPEAIQDAVAKVAVRLRDTYFVNLTVSNYERRALERPMMPGGFLRVRPWEGRIEDVGLELIIDINNNLEARERREDPEVTVEGLRAVTGLLREVATTSGPVYADTGELSMEQLIESSLT
jgi:hypothetical protein